MNEYWAEALAYLNSTLITYIILLSKAGSSTELTNSFADKIYELLRLKARFDLGERTEELMKEMTRKHV